MSEFIFWIIPSVISTLCISYLFYKISNNQLVNLKVVIIFIFGAIFLTLLKCYNINSAIGYFIFYPILFYSISKQTIKKVIISTLIIWLIGIVLDVISMLLAMIFCYRLNISLEKYYVYLSIGLSIFVSLIFVLIGKTDKLKTILAKTIKFFSDIEYSNIILIFFCLAILILSIDIFINLEKIHVNMLLFIIVMLIILTFILLIKFKINDVENHRYLTTLKENNDFYIKIEDENRIFKHNLMAKLSSIKSVSNKKAISLIDDFLVKTTKNVSYSKRIKRIPYGLNGIIYQKTYSYLDDINFKVNNKIDFDIFKVLKPRRYNVLVEKLVVCLDNAIEASLNSKSKVVLISLYDDEDNIYIEIKNSFAHNLDVDNLGNLNYSTKGKRRGLGLFSILRDNEASVNIRVVNNYFISTISARKQK